MVSIVNIYTIFKILGSISICFSCAMIGIYFSYKTDYRINDLDEIRKALIVLRSEIDFAFNTLPNAFFHISERTGGKTSVFFTNIANRLEKRDGKELHHIWREEINNSLYDTYLTSGDLAVLEQLGKTLGYLDKSLQTENISMITNYLDEKISELRIISEKNKRLYRSLGILFGLLITIIFI